MPRHNSHRLLVVVPKLYQALLIVYPEEHRREYGLLMVQTFRDMCRDTYWQRGMPGLILLSVHTLVDTVITSMVEHLDRLEYGARRMTQKQHFFALVSAGFPLVLGLVLFAFNPHYMGRMFMPGYANVQPQGGIMTAGIVALAATAYMTQRWGLTLSSRLVDSQSTGKAVIPGVFVVGSFVLFILPAVLLVLFGPAMLLLMEAGVIG